MDPFLGQIVMFGGNFAPRGWALCEGQLLPISQYSALFSILGTIYGGDGRTTFALPDLRSRTPIGSGRGAGLSDRRLGSRSGMENVTLNVTQIPAHTHLGGVPYTNEDGNENDPSAANALAKASVVNGRDSEEANIYKANPTSVGNWNVNVGNAGGNQSHTNMQPYLTVNYIIALVGVFPSRN